MFKDWGQFLRQPFAYGRVEDYVWCAGILLATLLLRKPVSRLLVFLFLWIGGFRKDKHAVRDCKQLYKPVVALLSITGIFYAFTSVDRALSKVRLFKVQTGKTLRYLKLSVLLEHIILLFAIIALTWLIIRLADFFYRRQLNKALNHGRRNKVQLYSLTRDVIRIFIWVIAFFWILGTVFEVNVPALITGLGIGGVALALAAKESVENLFASFTILADKPLAGGDVIRLGTLEGTVESVGFRSTRLRHADGSLIIVPNKKIVDGFLENLTQRASKAYTIILFLKKGMPAARLEALRKSVDDLLQETKNIQKPVMVRVESPNENAWQLVASYNLPFPAPAGLAPEDFKETMKLKIYGLVQEYGADKMEGAEKMEGVEKVEKENDEV